MQDIFDVPPWATDPVGWQPPSLGFDLLSAVRYVARSVSDAKRGHDLRVARDEVWQAIAAYCAALPASPAGPAVTAQRSTASDDRAATDDEQANAQICSTSPAIR
jgi:hypothetical protein